MQWSPPLSWSNSSMVFSGRWTSWVKFKETVGNSWAVLKVILGHKYHHSHYMRSISADYSQNPQQKVSFLLLHILSLIVSSSRRMLHFDVWPSFPVTNVNASLMPILARQSYSRLNVFRLQFFSVHFPCFLIAVACLTRPLRSPFAIHDADSKQSKKNIWKNK